jgi:hypothetical protein
MSVNEGWCPGLNEQAHDQATDAGWNDLLSKDMDTVAKNSGARRDGANLVLRIFNRDCVVDTSCRQMSIEEKKLQPLAQILVLHYLANAVDVEPTGKLIPYRQLPDGSKHNLQFKSKVVDEIGHLYRGQPQMLLSVKNSLKAKKMTFGEASIQLNVFPRLPVTVIVWRSDDVVHGMANLLFDETAPRHMSTEDLAGVGSYVLLQLIKSKNKVLREVGNRNELDSAAD